MHKFTALLASLALFATAAAGYAQYVEDGKAPTKAVAGGAIASIPMATVKPAKTPITFDGHFSKFEYSDAAHLSFPNAHGTIEAYVKELDGYLYFAFEIPDDTVHIGDDMVIMLDTKNARADKTSPDTIRAYVRRKPENSRMEVGNGKSWVDDYMDWEYKSATYATGWEVEARIPLKSIGVTGDAPAKIGLCLRAFDNQPMKSFLWPAGADEVKPATWGTLTIEPK